MPSSSRDFQRAALQRLTTAEFLVKHYIKESSQPERMWLVVAGIGFASTVLMLIYDQLVGRTKAGGRLGAE